MLGRPGDGSGAGGVRVLRGSAVGPDGTLGTYTQRTAGVPSDAVADEHFGASVAIANRRLLIGAPGEHRGRGTLTVMRLRATGRVAAGAGVLRQRNARPGDHLGAAVASTGTRIAVGSPGARGGRGSVLLVDAETFRNGRVLTLGTFGARPEAGAQPHLGAVLGR